MIDEPINEAIARIIYEATDKDEYIQPTVTKLIKSLATFEGKQRALHKKVSLKDYLVKDCEIQEIFCAQLFKGEFEKYANFNQDNLQLLPLINMSWYVQNIKNRLVMEEYLAEFLNEHVLLDSQAPAQAVMYVELVKKTKLYVDKWEQNFDKIVVPNLLKAADDMDHVGDFHGLISLSNIRRLALISKNKELYLMYKNKMARIGVDDKLLDAYDYYGIDKKAIKLVKREIQSFPRHKDDLEWLDERHDELCDLVRFELLVDYFSEKNSSMIKAQTSRAKLHAMVETEHDAFFNQSQAIIDKEK